MDRFERLMDEVDTWLIERPTERCICPKCSPVPPRTRTPQQCVELPNWSGNTAMQAFGLRWISMSEHRADKIMSDMSRKHGEYLEGYTIDGGVWLRPTVILPVKTLAHEIAHNLLGHPQLAATIKARADAGTLHPADMADFLIQKELAEAEVEAVALLVVDALGYPDGVKRTLSETLQYIGQHAPGPFPAYRRERVIATARRILAAGRREVTDEHTKVCPVVPHAA